MRELATHLDCRCLMSSVVFDVYGWDMPEVPTASLVLPSTPKSENFIRNTSPQYINIEPSIESGNVYLAVRFNPSCQGYNKLRLNYGPTGPAWLTVAPIKIWSLQLYLMAGQYGLARVFHVDTTDDSVILDSEAQRVDVVSNFSKIQQSYTPPH